MSTGTCKLWAGKMYLIFSARGPYISEGETDCMTVNVHQLLQPILFNILINARFETVNSRTCMCSLTKHITKSIVYLIQVFVLQSFYNYLH